MYAAHDAQRPICDDEFFQPSQYSVDIHLNSLVIRFLGVKKIAVAHWLSQIGARYM